MGKKRVALQLAVLTLLFATFSSGALAAENFNLEFYVNTSIPLPFGGSGVKTADVPANSVIETLTVFASCSGGAGGSPLVFEVKSGSTLLERVVGYLPQGWQNNNYFPLQLIQATKIETFTTERECAGYGNGFAQIHKKQNEQAKTLPDINIKSLDQINALLPNPPTLGKQRQFIGFPTRQPADRPIDEELLVKSSNPNVLVWIDPLPPENAGVPTKFTAKATEFNKQVFACMDTDRNGVCDEVEAQVCGEDGWFGGGCCNGQGSGTLLSSDELTLTYTLKSGTQTTTDTVSIGEAATLDFSRDIQQGDQLKLRIDSPDQELNGICQLCRSYSTGNRNSPARECKFFGNDLTINFNNGNPQLLDLRFDCGNHPTNVQLCRSYSNGESGSSIEKECSLVDTQQFIQTDLHNDETNDIFELSLEYANVDMSCGDIIKVNGEQALCGKDANNNFKLAKTTEPKKVLDFTGCTTPNKVVTKPSGFDLCGPDSLITGDDNTNSCGATLSNGNLCSYINATGGLDPVINILPNLTGDVREVPCAGGHAVSRGESWITCPEEFGSGVQPVGNRDYLCNLTTGAVYECTGGDIPKGTEAEKRIKYQSVKVNDRTFYCTEDRRFVTDLDSLIIARRSDMCRNALEPGKTIATFKYTGSLCCSEADDSFGSVREFYNDVEPGATAACWNGTLAPEAAFISKTQQGNAGGLPTFIATSETPVVVLNGTFFGCSIPEGDLRLSIFDHHRSEQLIDNRQRCAVITRSSVDVGFVCDVDGKWKRASDSALGQNRISNQTSREVPILPGFNLLTNPDFSKTKEVQP